VSLFILYTVEEQVRDQLGDRLVLPFLSFCFVLFLRLFCRMRNRSLVGEGEFTRLVGRSVGRSLGRKLLFVFPLTNAQLDLKRKMSSNGSANVKHSKQ